MMTNNHRIINLLNHQKNKEDLPQVVFIISDSDDDIINCITAIYKRPTTELIEVDLLENKKNISINQIRDFRQKLIQSSRGTRLSIIRNFHKITKEASNALLKIFEELPTNNHILLIAEKDNISATLKSRVNLTINNLTVNYTNTIEIFQYPLNHNLLEKIFWNEKSFKIDLPIFLKNLLKCGKIKNLQLKEQILNLYDLSEKSINAKIILDYLAILTSRKKFN